MLFFYDGADPKELKEVIKKDVFLVLRPMLISL